MEGCIPTWVIGLDTGGVEDIASNRHPLGSIKHGQSPGINAGDGGNGISLVQDEAGEKLKLGTNGVAGSVTKDGESLET